MSVYITWGFVFFYNRHLFLAGLCCLETQTAFGGGLCVNRSISDNLLWITHSAVQVIRGLVWWLHRLLRDNLHRQGSTLYYESWMVKPRERNSNKRKNTDPKQPFKHIVTIQRNNSKSNIWSVIQIQIPVYDIFEGVTRCAFDFVRWGRNGYAYTGFTVSLASDSARVSHASKCHWRHVLMRSLSSLLI